MFDAFRELMEPEIKEAMQKAVQKATQKATEKIRKDMILNALKSGSSAEEISRVMGIPLAEIKSVEKEGRFLQ